MLFEYLRLETKKGIRRLIAAGAGLILVLVAIFAGVFIFMKVTVSVKERSLMTVGVSSGDEMTDYALKLLASLESVRGLLEFVSMDEDELIPAIESGSVDAAIFFPEHFVEDADTGINTPLTVYFPADMTGQRALLADFIMDAVSYIRTAQAGVYAAYDLTPYYAVSMDYYEIGNYLAERYMSEWGRRNRLFEDEVITPFGALGYADFYAAVGMFLALMASGGIFAYLFDDTGRGMRLYLSHAGLSAKKQYFARLAVLWMFMFAISLVYDGMILLIRHFASELLQDVSFISFSAFPPGIPVLLAVSLVMALFLSGIFTAYNLLAGKGNAAIRAAVLVASSFLIVFFTGNLIYKEPDVSRVGIFSDGSVTAKKDYKDELIGIRHETHFTEYAGEREMKAAIRKGELLIGFGFFYDDSGELSIKAYHSPFSFGDASIKETIYTRIFRDIVKDITLSEADNVFDMSGENKSDEIRSALLDNYMRQLDGNDVINAEVQKWEIFKIKATKPHDHSLLMLLFAAAVFIVTARRYRYVFTEDGHAVSLFVRGRRFIIPFMIFDGLCVTVGAVSAVYFATGWFYPEMLLIWAITAAAVYLAGHFIRRNETFSRAMPALLLALIAVLLVSGVGRTRRDIPYDSGVIDVRPRLLDDTVLEPTMPREPPAPEEPTAPLEPAASPVSLVPAEPFPEILCFVDAHGECHEAYVDQRVQRHDYDWSCLVNDDGNISYTDDDRYHIRKGVDVSSHQGGIDWSKVKADGYDFAFVRMVYRGYGEEGSLNLDSRALANIRNAQAAGIDVGVYVFSQAVNVAEAREEAELVIKNLEGITLQLPVVFYPELIMGKKARTNDVTGEQFTKNTIEFCERVREAGFEPMIYANMKWEAFLFDMYELREYPVWYADYEPVPQTPYKFTFWQCTDKGRVDGISGVTDIDIWFIKNGDG